MQSHRTHSSIRVRIIAIAMVCAMTVAAQPKLRAPEMYVGIQAGATASMVYFSPSSTTTPLLQQLSYAPYAGLVFRYAGHKVCGLQAELNYMQRGWSEPEQNYTRRLHYLEVPMLTHLCFGRKQVRGFFNIGPQIGYCVYDNTPSAPKEDCPQYKPTDHRFDWGVAAGLGLLAHANRAGTYQLEARFNYSLGSIYPTRFADFTMANPMDVSLTLAWLWPLNPPTQRK